MPRDTTWWMLTGNLYTFLRYCHDERDFDANAMLAVLATPSAWAREFEEFRAWGTFNECDGTCDDCCGSYGEPNCVAGQDCGRDTTHIKAAHYGHDNGCPWDSCEPCPHPCHRIVGVSKGLAVPDAVRLDHRKAMRASVDGAMNKEEAT